MINSNREVCRLISMVDQVVQWPSDRLSSDRNDLYSLVRALGRNKMHKEYELLYSVVSKKVFHRISLKIGCDYYEAFRDFEGSRNFALSIYEKNPNDSYVINKLAVLNFALSDFFSIRNFLNLSLNIDSSKENMFFCAKFYADICDFSSCQDLVFRIESDYPNFAKDELKILKLRIDPVFLKGKQVNRFPILCLNLDSDVRKRVLSQKFYSSMFIDYHRVSAIDGRILPSTVLSLLNPRANISSEPGTIGCFLGHIAVWRYLIEKNLDYALIIEDDGLPFCDFKKLDLNILNDLNFDLLFVNNRLSSLRTVIPKNSGVSAVLARLFELPERQSGWGADGYFLTKFGAKKLINYVEQDLICGHLDGQLVSYGIDGEFQPINRASKTASLFLKNFKSTRGLKAGCFNFPLIQDVDFGASSR